MSLRFGAVLNTQQRPTLPPALASTDSGDHRLPLNGSSPIQVHAPSMLQIVDLQHILLHEAHDLSRAEPLGARIAQDGMQRHPVILAYNRYGPLVHLDGANRIAALAGLGCRHVAAQIVDYADPCAVTLDTWLHLARFQAPDLLATAASWRCCALHATTAEQALELLSRDQAAAAVLFRDGHAFALLSGMGLADRVEVMQHLIDAQRGPVVREAMPQADVLTGMRDLLNTNVDADACIVFATLSKADVITLASNMKALLPSGITRHMVSCGRVLNVNVPLSLLRSDLPGEEKTRQLSEMLAKRRQRLYTEPIVAYESY
jgi:L-serine kinase (ATP) / ParB family transcriptional regulator, heme-responsive regulator